MPNIYETRRLLDEYLLFHYGSDSEVMPWPFGPKEALGFATRTVHELIDGSQDKHSNRQALDLGCAVGRSSFELASLGCEVIGIDYSQSFIDAAAKLQRGEALNYQRLDEGNATTELVARATPGTVSFEQGDAMNLRADLSGFGLVHAANLLCRLTHPQKLIARLPSLINSGGQLLLTTPCTWLAEFTPPENWPQGRTRDWLIEQLSPHFELEAERDMPFLIREHARKYQWSVAWGTRWRRRE
jgi:putative 4-mercaptohistidine N1-methyltranferase